MKRENTKPLCQALRSTHTPGSHFHSFTENPPFHSLVRFVQIQWKYTKFINKLAKGFEYVAYQSQHEGLLLLCEPFWFTTVPSALHGINIPFSSFVLFSIHRSLSDFLLLFNSVMWYYSFVSVQNILIYMKCVASSFHVYIHWWNFRLLTRSSWLRLVLLTQTSQPR